MIRYFALLLVLAVGLIAAKVELRQIYALPVAPPGPRNAPLVQQLLSRPLSPDPSDLAVVQAQLAELGHQQELRSLWHYEGYRAASRVLGIAFEPLQRVADAVAWDAQHADATPELARQMLANAVTLDLAPVDAPPPLAGRSGLTLKAQFQPAGEGVWLQQTPAGQTSSAQKMYFVLALRNLLRVPLRSVRFDVVTRDASGQVQPLPLPERSYLYCDDDDWAGRALKLAPGESGLLLCELQIGGTAAAAPAQLQAVLRQVRTGTLQLTAWIRQLRVAVEGYRDYDGLQATDYLTSAEFGHPPSAKTDASLLAVARETVGPPRPSPRQTTCEQREDCPKTTAASFKGQLQDLVVLFYGAIPGVLLAGVLRGLALKVAARRAALLLLGGLSVLALIIAFAMGGSGWGPLAYMIIVGGVEIGLWLGLLLGNVALGWNQGASAA